MKLAIAKIVLEKVLNRFKYRAITDLLVHKISSFDGTQTSGRSSKSSFSLMIPWVNLNANSQKQSNIVSSRFHITTGDFHFHSTHKATQKFRSNVKAM